MNKLKYKSIGVLSVIGVIIVPLLIINGIFYLLGSFVAMDWDFHNWWVFKSTLGRILVCIVELCILANVPKFWDEIV